MTYHLASLRLRSIGERSARFNDLTINTLGPDQTPLDHVVWLRNGGGKSSLLSLFYALLLPRKYDFMGRAVQRDLTDYVEGGDTAHTIAAWHSTTSPSTLDGRPERVLVTGSVYEWEDLRRPTHAAKDADRLGRTYYAFYAIPGVLDLDLLPLTDPQGRPTRRNDYIQHIRDLAANHPKTDLVITRIQSEWATALTARGLDPDLFLTQKKMNHVEGGVEDMFRFASAKEFIDFLLNLTVTRDAVATIADNMSEISDKVAKKPQALTERDFLAETVLALDRLANAHQAIEDAQTDVGARTTDAADLAAQFAATITAALQALATTDTERTEADRQRTQFNTDRAAANGLAYLYTLRAAELRVAEAQAALDAAKHTADTATHTEKVWTAVGPLADHRDLLARLTEATRAAEAEERELAPLRETHDRYAYALKALLVSLADAEDEHRDTQRQAAADARSLHQQKKTDADTADTEAAIAATEAAKLDGLLTSLDDDLRRAVHTGTLPALDTDPADHARTLTTTRAHRQEALDQVQARRRQHPETQRVLSDRMADLAAQRAEHGHTLSALREDHTRLNNRATTLATTARVQNLLESTDDTPVDLWGDHDVLTRRLIEEIHAADAAIVREHVTRTDAARVTTAVEQTRLLPSTLDADRIKATLTEAGIPAQTGWEHYRTLTSTDRLVAALTDTRITRLGAGVIVPAHQVTEARTALTAAGETTTALVGLYTPADLDAALTDGTDDGVPPAWTNLASGLVDPAAAERVAAATDQRVRDHDAAATAHAATRDTDRRLLDDLTRFLTDCPAGHLDTLTHQISGTEATLDGLHATIEATQKSLDRLTETITADEEEAVALTGQISQIDQTLAALADLTAKTAHRTEWTTAKTAADTRHDDAKARARHFTDEANAALEAAHRHDAAAADHTRRANEHRTNDTNIHYLGTPPTAVADVSADLDTLRTLVTDAHQAYATPASQSVYAERVRSLSEQVAARARDLPTDPTIRTEAETLLDTPRGASIETRNQALAAATEARADADRNLGTAEGHVTVATKTLRQVQESRAEAPRRILPVNPNDAAHAETLATEQQEISARLREDTNLVEERIATIDKERTRLDNLTRMFGLLQADLPDPTATTTAPFPGDDTAAKARKTSITQALRTAEQHLQTQREELADILKDLSRSVSRYPTVTGKFRDRLLYDDTTLPPAAAALATEFRVRITQLEGQLAEIAEDQNIVAGQLATIVREHLDMIRRAERYSLLPETLGVLGNKKLLTISFDKPTDADLHTYVNRVVENQILQGAKPEGLDLLKAAIHEAVGHRGFKVKVLKPTHDLTATSEDIAALAKWSGGEKLTVCVALYCTIAKLRAVNTGRKEKSGGMLILDNPIGRASHGPLIQLQRKVAASQGVQLIYATGVKDFDAVSLFPGITRLANNPGKTNSRRYIINTDTDTDGIQGSRVSHLDRHDRPHRETA